jgi:hypothetical protein
MVAVFIIGTDQWTPILIVAAVLHKGVTDLLQVVLAGGGLPATAGALQSGQQYCCHYCDDGNYHQKFN